MRNYIRVILLLLSAQACTAAAQPDKSLLKHMDDLINNRHLYMQQKTDRIAYLKQLAEAETNEDRKYDITDRIIHEYSNFQADSAFVYIEKNRSLAEKYDDPDRLTANRFQYAFVCAQSGLFNETRSALESLPVKPKEMNKNRRIEYFRLCERFYMNLKEYAQGTHMEEKYRKKELAYGDSVMAVASPDSQLYYLYKFKKEFADNKPEEAEKSIRQYIRLSDSISNDAARGYYFLSRICKIKEDFPNEEKYLIQSVEADIKSAVKQNRSLRVLARLLYEKGDAERAYHYLRVSSEDANFYNTRFRNSQIAEALPGIEKEYRQQRDRQESRLRAGIAIISGLTGIILVFSVYLSKKRKQLADARKKLMKINADLTVINEEIKKKNTELNRLAEVLRESDQVKEKYVGYFLKLCSDYIQKMGEYQKLVNRKIKVGQIEDLYKITSSGQYIHSVAKEFYRKFDEAFLSIYPNFVEDFNQLLRENQRFVLKNGDLLNTELRMFALIRLGIKDSAQIAEFMGYTPVTIYSYRTKVKSRAIDKDRFDRDIMAIKRNV